MKYEKFVSVLYFVVCFAKTFAKYPQNAKYKKCIAGLTNKPTSSSNYLDTVPRHFYCTGQLQ